MNPAAQQEDSEALLQFLYLAPIGLVQLDMHGEVALMNPLCAQLLMPLAPAGGLSNLFEALQDLAPDLARRARHFEAPYGKVCEAMLLPVRAGTPGQRAAQVLSLTLLKLDDQRLMGVIDDVSVQLQRERELRQSQAWIRTIVDGITDYALLRLDPAGRVLEWNPGIQRLTGHRESSIVGQPYNCLHPDDEAQRAHSAERLREADSSGWNLEECWLQRADGSRFWSSCLLAPLQTGAHTPPDEQGYSLIVRDISQHREAHEALRRSVSCDHLTGLANRRAFFDAATRELSRCRQQGLPVSLVLLDADHFKAINDTHGHAAGDAVLKQLAAALSASFRANDVLARIGGEEFVALLPATDEEDACGVAARLCREIAAQPLVLPEGSLHCTVSAGVATMQPGVVDLDELLLRADRAMYEAKAGGRNRAQRWTAALLPPAEILPTR